MGQLLFPDIISFELYNDFSKEVMLAPFCRWENQDPGSVGGLFWIVKK